MSLRSSPTIVGSALIQRSMSCCSHASSSLKLAGGTVDGVPDLSRPRVKSLNDVARDIDQKLTAAPAGRALLDRVVHLEKRHVHRDHDEADDAADDDDHEGLEQ